MKEIPLTHGKVALVDDVDYELVNQFKWHAVQSKNGQTWYAQRNVPVNGKQKMQFMHRFIMGMTDHPKPDIDHRNHNGLDNQRDNLRVCPDGQNQRHQRKHLNNTSGYKGVAWHKKSGTWQANIRFQGRLQHLGQFACPIEAAHAYDFAALVLHGQFAHFNFPHDVKLISVETLPSQKHWVKIG